MLPWRMQRLLATAAAVGSILASAVPDQVDPKVELAALRHAQDDIGFLQEQDESRFKAAEEEIDRLVEKKHRLGAGANVAEEVAALQREASTMSAEANAVKDKDKADLAKKAETEAAELRGSAALLQGSSNDLKDVSAAIDRATAEGKAIDARMRERKGMRDGLELRIHQLERAEERAEEKKETANDLASFKHKAELTGAGEDGDDGYEAESADALEKALGWNQNELEERAQSAKDALSHGLGGARKVPLMSKLLR